MYRTAQNNTSRIFSFKPIWALFALLIPIFNLIGPYKILSELWVVNNKNLEIENYGQKQILKWCILSIGLFIFSRILNHIALNGTTIVDLLKYEYYCLVFLAISIHYLLLTKKLVGLFKQANYS